MAPCLSPGKVQDYWHGMQGPPRSGFHLPFWLHLLPSLPQALCSSNMGLLVIPSAHGSHLAYAFTYTILSVYNAHSPPPPN